MSTGFSWFVIIGTLGSLLVFFLLLWMNRKVSSKPGETTGHVYDGIEEYDNPMPAWWFWGFILSIVWGIGYLIWYPGLGNFPGLGGWTSEGRLAQQQAEAEERHGQVFAQYSDVEIDDLVEISAAMNMGRRLFAQNCAPCHGAAGTGSEGFPNLTDGIWQWGGEANQIRSSITTGRRGLMPGWVQALGEDGVVEVTEYTLQLSGRDVDEELAEAGAARYASTCVACHGADGGGQTMLGAPALNDDNWLYGGRREQVASVIRDGRTGEMPAFGQRLGDDRVHVLAAYVKYLSQQ